MCVCLWFCIHSIFAFQIFRDVICCQLGKNGHNYSQITNKAVWKEILTICLFVFTQPISFIHMRICKFLKFDKYPYWVPLGAIHWILQWIAPQIWFHLLKGVTHWNQYGHYLLLQCLLWLHEPWSQQFNFRCHFKVDRSSRCTANVVAGTWPSMGE